MVLYAVLFKKIGGVFSFSSGLAKISFWRHEAFYGNDWEHIAYSYTKIEIFAKKYLFSKLWRIHASKIRAFTAREYARIQTFPDGWVFAGNNKRDYQLQFFGQ